MQPAGLRPSSTRVSSSACSRTAAGSTSRRASGTPTTSSPPWSARSGGSSGRASRAGRRARGREGPGRHPAPSPSRFELDVDPETWFLEDDGYELAVFHSHVSAPPRPSRTDVENIGLWEGPPYGIR